MRNLKLNKTLVSLFAVGTILTTSACKDDDSSDSNTTNNNQSTAEYTVNMTDAPANYDEVNIDIKQVAVLTNNGVWTTLNTNAGVYNLLELSNGNDVVIAKDRIPAGEVKQMRFILGQNNTVVVEGEEKQLRIPSSMQSGILINYNQAIDANSNSSVLLDFDAAASLKEENDGNFKMDPVIRYIDERNTGAVEGRVNTFAHIYAVQGTDTISTFTNADGYFMIQGLNQGNYDVIVDPASPYQPKVFTSLSIKVGVDLDLGVITVIE